MRKIKMTSEVIFGIHLGLTYSEISVNFDNSSRIAKDTLDKEFIPNLVYILCLS